MPMKTTNPKKVLTKALSKFARTVSFVKYGRSELLIDEAGITIKDWRKNEILHWEEIEKCDIAWRTAMGHCFRCLGIKTFNSLWLLLCL